MGLVVRKQPASFLDSFLRVSIIGTSIRGRTSLSDELDYPIRPSIPHDSENKTVLAVSMISETIALLTFFSVEMA